ncbi:cobalt-precorrin 5A hydrolase [Desulfovibrio sp. TomC]|uniref:cobalt-precorrin 5A hydrolase n=1 Tax=Desulfovibrio sp. TomC TaxID=1562888 RepID=UPI000574CE30|nr:cobalt-precorrin 5A hydrolase [Desulfovibrio sp. TomC]KHK01857.1 Cobalamin biosynthesis protein CbiG [Desulfovibrio sp. TomC]
MTTPDIAIYAVTEKGARLGQTLAAALPSRLHALSRLAVPEAAPFASLADLVAGTFARFRAHIFICACGIAVRSIAPFVRDKTSDPAVVCLDDTGHFAISLLSGHLGGANDLARRVADLTGAMPVVTTATDAAGAPAIELLARDLGLGLDNPVATRRINAALAAGQPVAVFDPLGLFAVTHAKALNHFEWVAAPEQVAPDSPLILVDWRTGPHTPTRLYLRPRVLTAGVGCRRGTPAADILSLLDHVCRERRLAPGSLAALASIEAKRDEVGLLEAARTLGLDILFFTADQLAGVSVPHPSAVVAKHMGVGSVCEAAAILATGGGRLLAPKTRTGFSTAAIALAR